MKRNIKLGLLAILAFAATAFAGPFDTWGNFRPITVNTTTAGVTGTVTNFPLLVRLTNASTATGADVLNGSLSPNGGDIRFTDGTGSTALSYQIDTWNSTSAAIWVLVPTIAGNSSTNIRIYWGKSSQSDASDGGAVFDTANGFRSVWHLGDANNSATAPRPNSVTPYSTLTAKPANFTFNSGTVPSTVKGLIGLADTLLGSNSTWGSATLNSGRERYFMVDSGTATDAYNFPNGRLTFSYWSNATRFNATRRGFQLGSNSPVASAPTNAIQTICNTGTGTTNNYFRYAAGASGTTYLGSNAGGNTLVTNTWQLIMDIVSRGPAGDTLIKYVDGRETDRVFAAGTTNQLPNAARPYLFLGRDFESGADSSYYGAMDEFTFANATRSPDWVKLTYETQKPAVTAVSLGTTVSTVTLPNITTQPASQGAANGATALLSVVATGGVGTLAYQWQISTDGGASFTNVSTGSGGNTANYTTAALNPTNPSLQFHVIVTNGDGSGSVTSNAAIVTVGKKVWTGTTNANWSNAGNWSPSGAPAAGDSLVFPLGAANLTTNNDIAAATAFAAVVITGTGYTLAGNSVALTVGLTNSNGSNTVSLVLGGASGVTQSSTGTLTLSGVNTYTGTTTISGGVLNANSTTAIGSGAATNTLILNGGTLQASAAITSPSTRLVTIGTGGATIDNNGNAISIAGIISGTIGTLTKIGNGTLTLSGANTYIGPTFVNAGTLKAGVATSSFGSGSALTLANVSGVSLDITGFNTTIGSLSGGGATGGNVTLGAATLTLGNTANQIFSGIISGTGSLTKAGTGALTLTSVNTYTGTTTASAGTLVLGNASAISTSSGVTVTAGALDLNGNNFALPMNLAGAGINSGGALTNSGGNASYSGTITLTAAATIGSTGSGVLTVAGNISGATFALTLRGAGNGIVTGVIGTTTGTLIKNDAGTWTVSGLNTFTGTTTVTAGTLKLGTTGDGTNTPFGTAAAGTTVSSGGVLDLNGFTLSTAEGLTLSGTGISAGGALINSSATAVTYNGTITRAAATSIVANNGNIIGTGAISGNFGLTLDGTNTGSSLTGNISGTGALTKSGVGTWTLTGIDTVGAFTISAGTLVAPANLAVSGSWSNNGGTFTQGSGTVTLNGSSAQSIGGTNATTFNNLTLNNTVGATLTSSPTITGALTFTTGKITTDTNKVILGASASVSGAAAGKYVFGNLRRLIPNAAAPSVAFDVGDATSWRPVTVNFFGTTTGSGSLTASSTAGNDPNIQTATIDSAKNVNAYWTLTNTGIGGFTSYNAIFNWAAGDTDVAATTANFLVAKNTAGTWTYPAADNKTQTSIRATGLTGFSDFIVGELALLKVSNPVDTAVSVGNSAKFVTTVTAGTAPFTYKWVKSPYGAGDTIQTHASSSSITDTLRFAAAAFSDTGSYKMVASITGGLAISTPAHLTVTAVPAHVTSSPASDSVGEGSTIKLAVTATGTAPLSYRWIKNGTDSVGIGDTLTLTNVALADSGSFKCFVSNASLPGGGTDSSLASILKVTPRASITTQPHDTTVDLGAGASFTVAATGSGTLSYKWLKNGTDSVGAAATLSLSNVAIADTGSYSVVVMNTVGSKTARLTSAAARLILSGAPPAIVSPPAGVTGIGGTAAKIAVTVSGTTPLVYKWIHYHASADTSIHVAVADTLKRDTLSVVTDTLTIASVAKADTGLYRVVISNSLGTIASDTVRMLVRLPPTITSGSSNVTKNEFETAIFVVSASGDAPFAYQWFRTNKNGTVDTLVTSASVIGATSDTLRLTNLQMSADSTSYRCQVTNLAGSATNVPALLRVVHVVAINMSRVIRVTGSGMFNIRLPQDVTAVHVTIQDLRGHLVWARDFKREKDADAFTWNGVGSNGRPVSSGMYMLRMQLLNVDGAKTGEVKKGINLTH